MHPARGSKVRPTATTRPARGSKVRPTATVHLARGFKVRPTATSPQTRRVALAPVLCARACNLTPAYALAAQMPTPRVVRVGSVTSTTSTTSTVSTVSHLSLMSAPPERCVGARVHSCARLYCAMLRCMRVPLLPYCAGSCFTVLPCPAVRSPGRRSKTPHRVASALRHGREIAPARSACVRLTPHAARAAAQEQGGRSAAP